MAGGAVTFAAATGFAALPFGGCAHDPRLPILPDAFFAMSIFLHKFDLKPQNIRQIAKVRQTWNMLASFPRRNLMLQVPAALCKVRQLDHLLGAMFS